MDKKAILEALNKELGEVQEKYDVSKEHDLAILYAAQVQAYEKAISIVEDQ